MGPVKPTGSTFTRIFSDCFRVGYLNMHLSHRDTGKKKRGLETRTMTSDYIAHSSGLP